MTTHTAIHLHSSDVARIHPLCQAWMAEAFPRRAISMTRGPFPFKAFARVLSEDLPTLLALGLTEPDWVTIHYNSFHTMQGLAASLSDHLACWAVVVLAQTVSDSYFISVHTGGEWLRTLEFTGDAGWLVLEGPPFAFETTPLGQRLAEPGAPEDFFGEAEVEAYCRRLGFSLWDAAYDPEWLVLKARKGLCVFRGRGSG